MYKTHFGLKKRPFRAHAAGSDVFVGPQTASTMAGLKKALTASDTIVAVSGPVGVGKTTLVRRALEAVGEKQIIIPVARMQLGHDEVLELLLEEMGAQLPASTVQRFTTLRRLFKEHAENGARVFVIVEDAARVGADALSELEALTAADSGVSEGANIVLMGDENINDVLAAPRLARLKQRLRWRHAVQPLSASELTAYFKHCFRLAGKEYDTLFDEGAAELLHALSDGIPRMANNLVESVLTAAAEANKARVDINLIKKVAGDEYGMNTGEPARADVPVAAEPEVTPVPQAVFEEPETAPIPEPVAGEPEPQPEARAAGSNENQVHELIQDTLPDLAILAPQLANSPVVEEPEFRQSDALKAAQVAPSAEEVPDWERDPTLAELRPDLDALEHAMAIAQGLEPEPDAEESEANADKDDEPAEPVPEIILDKAIQDKIDEASEILRQAELEAQARKAAEEAEEEEARPKSPGGPSLEQQLDMADTHNPIPQSIQPPVLPVETPVAVTAEAVAPPPEAPVEPVAESEAPSPEAPLEPIAEPEAPPTEVPVVPVIESEAQPVPTTAPDPAVEVDTSPQEELTEENNAELQKIAVNLSRAKTIDDVDDKMAETLFGEEFSLIAAQVAANAPPELSANDDLEVAVEEPAVAPLPDFDGAAAVSVELKSDSNGPRGHFDVSASQRLATVRALNAEPHATPASPDPVTLPDKEPAAPLPDVNDRPESIEEQINTSITQTLKALSVRPPPTLNDGDDDDEDEEGGFFSRFRR